MGRHCRYIAQVDFVCLRKVMGGAIRSVFFMILMFFFRFPNTSSESFGPRRALFKDISFSS